jgi:hypothetical protein
MTKTNGILEGDLSGICERLTLTGLKGPVQACTLRMLELRGWDASALGNGIFRDCGPFAVLEEVVLSLFDNGDPLELSEALGVLLERYTLPGNPSRPLKSQAASALATA